MGNSQSLIVHVKNKKYDKVKDIINKFGSGVNVQDEEGKTALHHACIMEDVQLVELLMSVPTINPNIRDDSNHTPLHYACSKNSTDVALRIVHSNRADVNIQNSIGMTCLHIAINKKNKQIAKAILELDSVNPDVPDNSGWTVIHFAATIGCCNLYRMIPDHVDKTHHITNEGYSPLYFSVKHGHSELTEYLLSLPNCDPNIKTVEMFTPLHVAAMNQWYYIIKLLLENKADPDARTNKGKKPLHITQEEGFDHITELLVKHTTDKT